jgi:hypothetical protein
MNCVMRTRLIGHLCVLSLLLAGGNPANQVSATGTSQPDEYLRDAALQLPAAPVFQIEGVEFAKQSGHRTASLPCASSHV